MVTLRAAARVSLDGVDLSTAAPAGVPRFTGWCLDKEDPSRRQLCAFREQDRKFVVALLDAQLVDSDVITTRLRAVPGTHRVATGRALAWLASERSE